MHPRLSHDAGIHRQLFRFAASRSNRFPARRWIPAEDSPRFETYGESASLNDAEEEDTRKIRHALDALPKDSHSSFTIFNRARLSHSMPPKDTPSRRAKTAPGSSRCPIAAAMKVCPLPTSQTITPALVPGAPVSLPAPSSQKSVSKMALPPLPPSSVWTSDRATVSAWPAIC